MDPDTPVRQAIDLLRRHDFIPLGIGATSATVPTLTMQRREPGRAGVDVVTFVGDDYAMGVRCRDGTALDLPGGAGEEHYSGPPLEVARAVLGSVSGGEASPAR